jgi:hypothetical protein
VLFSPLDPDLLFFASNTVWTTRDGGSSWTEISPDLTRRDSVVPANVGIYSATPAATARHPGVIYTVAPSYRSRQVVWAGTDDGLIHVTRDGGRTWMNVTPPGLHPWAKVSLIDAGRFDSLTAYAAINTLRLDDLRPHIYRTHDAGRTWTHITSGIPDGGIVNAVREDPARRGLLYAGTEQAVYFSIDDGDHWQPLRLNMPATSVRDLVVKDDDLVVGTHGRGFWILDDLTPLRQFSAGTVSEATVLFRPQVATRVRWNMNTDTPLPPDEPVGENPPDGAILNYWLGAGTSGPVRLEILDSAGAVVRAYSSTDGPEPPQEGRNIPDYWLRPARVLPGTPGMHRFTWDLRYPGPAGLRRGYPISAVAHNTALEPNGPAVLPGRYTARLTANGLTVTQPLAVRMDPRVHTPVGELQKKFTMEQQLAEWLTWQDSAVTAARAMGRSEQVQALGRLGGELNTLYGILDDADAGPTAQVADAFARVERSVRALRGH